MGLDKLALARPDPLAVDEGALPTPPPALPRIRARGVPGRRAEQLLLAAARACPRRRHLPAR
ncbi:hypothetical protein SIN09_03805 [Streptomyces sp. F8]|nr:hypothetical protein [Streptomyces sp. F8]